MLVAQNVCEMGSSPLAVMAALSASYWNTSPSKSPDERQPSM
jgi:hypothetical protein